MPQSSPYCRRCGLEITWIRRNRSWVPYNAGGARHSCIYKNFAKN